MRGNFVDIPTDCPQRDERLGWTGDIQSSHPQRRSSTTAPACSPPGCKDVAAEQLPDGTVPWYVPVIPARQEVDPHPPGRSMGRRRTLTPWTVYERFGDRGSWQTSMTARRRWVDLMERLAGATGCGTPVSSWATGSTHRPAA